jgi:predicted MPP superfamily phosphohydrolase
MFLRYAIIILAAASAGPACQGNRIQVVSYEVNLLNSDSSLNIVQVSDLHYKPGESINNQVASEVQRLDPDVLLLTGDMIDDKALLRSFAEYLGTLPKVRHRFAILGNWEYWSAVDVQALREVYARQGIKLLVNEQAEIEPAGKTFQVIGLDDLLGGNPRMPVLEDRQDRGIIILAHCPQLYDTIYRQIPTHARGLILSGHTHGGQITLFGLPLRLPPGSGGYVAGIYHQEAVPLIVSRGIGTSAIPFRFFAKPDIIHIRVR